MTRVLLSLTLALIVSACGSSSSPLSVAPAPAPAPAPPTAAVDFGDFVREQINNASENREPVAINDLDFEFGNDPNAFDALFPTGN